MDKYEENINVNELSESNLVDEKSEQSEQNEQTEQNEQSRQFEETKIQNEEKPILEKQIDTSVKCIASNEEQMDALKQNLKKNIIFYATVILCCLMFTKYITNENDTTLKKFFNFSKLISSFIFSMLLGHSIHRFSHNINTVDYVNQCDNILTRNKFINNITMFFCRIIDFHSITHHDSSINKKIKNILFEFLNNVITQCVFGVWFAKYLLDFRAVLLWGLMYATTHNINYLYLRPSTHRDHHLHPSTNFGIDLTDILFNTKYNWNDIENYNHISINLIIITILIIYLKI